MHAMEKRGPIITIICDHSDVQYAKQFLAEEKRRDKKTRKVTWQQIGGRANHLLDCELYAAACADSSWTPSIRYLAKNEK